MEPEGAVILAVLADGDKVDAYVALTRGIDSVAFRYCGAVYRYTSERTAGGWWVYQRVE